MKEELEEMKENSVLSVRPEQSMLENVDRELSNSTNTFFYMYVDSICAYLHRVLIVKLYGLGEASYQLLELQLKKSERVN